MAKRITRCPKCKTAFRVTEVHLNTAKGAVRCGSCLNIFVARDYLVDTSISDDQDETEFAAESNTQQTSTGDTIPIESPSKSAAINTTADDDSTHTGTSEDDSLLISDDMDEEPIQNDFDENIIVSTGSSSVENNLFEVSRFDSEQDDSVASDTDESWALDLLKEEPEESPEFVESQDFGIEESPMVVGADEDYSAEFASITNIDQATDDDIEAEIENDLSNTGKFSTFEIVGDENVDEDYYSEEISDEKYGVYNTGQNAYVDAIEPEAVEFSWKPKRRFWRPRQIWAGLSFVAVIAAFVQLAYFKFDDLNRVAPYRQYYQIACDFLDCKLPGLVDLAQIKAANLVVRSHPEAQGMLLVDAILQNNAKYEQAFPALDLVFTDIENQPVAAKRFLPNEYLAGELSGRTIMPSNQPIHIALEITDPGERAVSYQMSISQAKK